MDASLSFLRGNTLERKAAMRCVVQPMDLTSVAVKDDEEDDEGDDEGDDKEDGKIDKSKQTDFSTKYFRIGVRVSLFAYARLSSPWLFRASTYSGPP